MTTGTIQTPYGVFSGVVSQAHYPDGRFQGLRLEDRNVILTHAGELVPFYGEETLRRKSKASVTFHENGMIKAVALEEQQEVMTPIGELPAELITFYDTGEVHRVFPLDGHLSGFWSEEDERELNIPLSFDLGFTSFTAMLSCICFYKSGQIKSVTLFPGEEIDAALRGFGQIKARHGFSLYDTGELESIEPAEPVRLQTPAGLLTAYDPSATGISADSNSLVFDKEGRLAGLKTAGERILAKAAGGAFHSFSPAVLCADDACSSVSLPINIRFQHDSEAVIISDDQSAALFSFHDDFFIHPADRPNCSPADCASCSLCKK
ncbi:hypothetical protein SAMN02745823_01850 [Sporobacter termitidis DSM 10068]|uniref:Uncharacterized protein n=1 Tax=Sporobacter termitidis DSM 10068 TaxID=1123282 RepID=A0A1M5XIL1_9FIRM|nr:hypothetical protein [Sporobacter termitidis]SHH99641.1 hypothetical protein SAMN02745823_01850 [Sporobacter termitidis DSM 10068]